MTRSKLIAGNWKMNGVASTIGLAAEIGARTRDFAGIELLLCPPATLVARVAAAVAGTNASVGGQDCHPSPEGPHTGDISAEMLADAGARYVILGHSERRTDHGESDALVRAKAQAAWRAGLVPIVCVGETLAEREAGKTFEVLESQLLGSLPAEIGARALVLAYEPVWAIGTGKTPTAAEVAAAHQHVRATLGRLAVDAQIVRILYGGSMKPTNAAELLAIDGVDGGLIGGASLKAADFLAIAGAARSSATTV